METDELNLGFVDEALSLVHEAAESGINLRILGSIAYRLQCPQHLHLFGEMQRALTDVDFAAEKKQNQPIREFFINKGYVPDEGVYMASEGSRHIYLHPETNLNIDVFSDELFFCHRIPFVGRLTLDSPTICTTDLLLEKMQIVEINLKDFKDTIVLLLEHDLGRPGAKNGKTIDTDYIGSLMASDWGFYYTFTTNLNRVKDHLDQFDALPESDKEVIRSRIDELINLIEASPKSLKWKLRAAVGTKKIWYQEVSEKASQF